MRRRSGRGPYGACARRGGGRRSARPWPCGAGESEGDGGQSPRYTRRSLPTCPVLRVVPTCSGGALDGAHDPLRPSCLDHVGLQVDQFFREHSHPVDAAGGPTNVHPVVAASVQPTPLEPLYQPGELGPSERIIFANLK